MGHHGGSRNSSTCASRIRAMKHTEFLHVAWQKERKNQSRQITPVRIGSGCHDLINVGTSHRLHTVE